MSGHSKWSTIKRKKEATDQARAKIFTKIGREMTVCVKEGGADPSTNAKLRDLIAKAKANNVPSDNIDRVIKKASGGEDKNDYISIVYEGYGPNGIAVIVETLTDNKNRTAGDVRHYFDKFGGNLGTSGCVSFMFQSKGIVVVENNGYDEDKLMEVAMNAGAEDFKSEPEGYEIITEPGDFEAVSKALDEAGITCANASITQLPTMITPVAPDMVENVQKLIDALEDQDDVQEVFTNADM